MKTTRPLPLLAAAAFGGFLGGCASSPPPTPFVHYPVTYQVPVGGAKVAEKLPDPSLNVTASQDVAVEAGKPLYYQITSPVPVTVYLYEKVGASPGANLLTHVAIAAGQTVRERVVPPTSSVEFLFADNHAGSPGTLQVTLSDEPLAGGPDRPSETFIGH